VGVTEALAAAVGGNALVVLAAAVTPTMDTGDSLAPWLTGGGSAAAVAGLVYVARMVVKGDLVPRAVAEREREATEREKASAARKDELLRLSKELVDLTHESQARETVLSNMGGEAVRALTLAQETSRQNTEELRWWRDRRERTERREST